MDFYAQITSQLYALNAFLWGAPMLLLVILTGIFLMCGLNFLPFRNLFYAMRLLFSSENLSAKKQGDVSPFNALMTSLSGAVGTGNVAGVATAIHLGGPGALFYMWLAALIGMATSFTEAACAVKFRVQDSHHHSSGGPMYYIRSGFSGSSPLLGRFLAALYALLTALSVLSIGNMVQINSIAAILSEDFQIEPLTVGLVVMCLVGFVILGGIKRIAHFAGRLVPLMVGLYLFSGLAILCMHYDQILSVLQMVFLGAFSPEAVSGGVVGSGMSAAMRYGIARGVFSNEAGLGTASIAHAAARTNDPIRQGHFAMLGTFLDTIVVCSITGFIILITQSHVSGATGAVLTGHAFAQAIPGGNMIVTLALVVFAFTTMIGYSYYGEKCIQYLLGDWVLLPYRLLWLVVIPLGAVFELDLVWALCEMMMALMMIPNLIGLIVLGPYTFKSALAYNRKLGSFG